MPSGSESCALRLICVNELFDPEHTTSNRLFERLVVVPMFQSRASCRENADICWSPVFSTVATYSSMLLFSLSLLSRLSRRLLVGLSITPAKSLTKLLGAGNLGDCASGFALISRNKPTAGSTANRRIESRGDGVIVADFRIWDCGGRFGLMIPSASDDGRT